MRIAVICEYSGVVREAFTKLGHDATSFDILPTEQPGKHIQGDIMDLPLEYWKQFDLAICHPPCTHLSVSGARWFTEGRKPMYLREQALDFVRYLMNLPVDKICIENPVSVISSHIRKADQTINPWQFGHMEAKRTCLWLKNLPKLIPTNNVYDEMMKLPIKIRNRLHWLGSGHSKERSLTFQGIADAMANQWGEQV